MLVGVLQPLDCSQTCCGVIVTRKYYPGCEKVVDRLLVLFYCLEVERDMWSYAILNSAETAELQLRHYRRRRYCHSILCPR